MNELNGKYLEIQRLILKERYRRIRPDEDWENRGLAEKKQNPADYYKQLEEIVAEAQRRNYDIPLEKISRENNLSSDEKELLVVLFFNYLRRERISGRDLLEMVAGGMTETLEKLGYLHPEARLIKSGLVKISTPFSRHSSRFSALDVSYSLAPETFYQICGLEPNGYEPLELEEETEKRPQKSVLMLRAPEVTFDHLFLPEPIKEQIECALWQYENGEKVFQEFRLKEKITYGTGTIILFYGPPGTGKTATAEAIAHRLGKKIGFVDYPQLYNCFFGETEKNIQLVFQTAREENCVLVFDEADACFGVRLAEHHSTDRSYNLMTNVLMQEIERFNGLLILTTNREFAIDPAFDRRILLKLNFALPEEKIREKIWEHFLKDCPRLAEDVSLSELARRYPVAGGRIKNAVLKVIIRCARNNKPITMADLEAAAREEMPESKNQTIGF